jgi:hypothetical protein
MLKFFPGWGNVVCGMVAGAGTYAVGRSATAVTLDPNYDTPKVLSEYAGFHHAISKIWTLATPTTNRSIPSPARSLFTGRMKAVLFHMTP